RRPVEWLLEHAALDARWCLVHATHMTADETQRLARSGAVAGLCPITEANLGDGCFPGLDYATHAGAFGIGSDSNVQIGPAAELRQLEYSQRLQLRARNVLSVAHLHLGRALFEAALHGGARALDVPAGIQLGAPADLVSLDLRAAAFASRETDEVLDSWIFTAPERCIDAVWSAGVQVVQSGRHRARDAIQARYRRVLEKLLRA
ncbi:MAG TPA: amidohydrolase family protein, partial [Polyangiales bacterium]|nr:amidohydrolase family protein [Polyangiales bacterium]